MASTSDAYATLGVSPSVTDAELRSAYRRLVQEHHPDHNGGSAESARRFEAIQDAYARVREQRAGGAGGAGRASGSGGRRAGARPTGAATPPPGGRDGVEDRLRAMEQELREQREAREAELREARAARERAAQAAREAAATTDPDGARRRASDEELGIYSTDDSFSKILADVRADVSEVFGKAISAAERAAEEAVKRAGDRHRDDSDDQDDQD